MHVILATATKVTGTNESKRASGIAAQPTRKRLILGTLHRCTPKGLANFGEFGKSLDASQRDSPASDGMQPRLFQAGFAISGSGCLGLAESGPHAPDCAHVASVPDYRQP